MGGYPSETSHTYNFFGTETASTALTYTVKELLTYLSLSMYGSVLNTFQAKIGFSSSITSVMHPISMLFRTSLYVLRQNYAILEKYPNVSIYGQNHSLSKLLYNVLLPRIVLLLQAHRSLEPRFGSLHLIHVLSL